MVYLKSLPPQGYFGAFNDDAYYYGSAKALAQGRGYIIPSLPGCPRQTKTPVLYPWLLSWVWRWYPSFPSNITPAAWVTAFFGGWFLVAAFELLRRLKGVGDRAAIIIVALCAFHPTVLLLSRTVMTDVPFAALVLTAAFAADGAMRTQAKPLRAVLVGILVGLAVMTRTMGLVAVAGVAAVAGYRRAYRQAALFCLAAAPFLFYVLWSSRSSLAAASMGLAHGATSAFPGYEQTLVYYTCYQRYWRLCVPHLSVFFAMLPTNLGGLLQAAPLYLISPTLETGRPLTSVKPVLDDVIAGAVSLLVVAGIVRQARNSEWKPIHFIMAFNTALMLVWNWPIADRYNLAFVPLFYMGLWLEGEHLLHLLLVSWRQKRPTGEKVLAGVMLTGVLALSAVVLWNYVYGFRPKLSGLAGQRSLIGLQKAQAYDWIRRNTDPGVTIMTYDDASLYLYTGRTAMPPLAFSTEYYYTGNKRVLERDLARMTDAARAVEARYWLVSDDDVPSQVEDAQPLIRHRIESLLSQMPEVFHSGSGQVRLYDISRLVPHDQPSAEAHP
jgi:4-amino-4-deoxy-L-arabinose transferase-like glycosyltransferase